jgi:hypothetical protein
MSPTTTISSAIPDPTIYSQQYLEILEKTNQQLSLWYSPYTLSISILTLLVAFLAIFFAYILWKQGREYKQAFNDFLQEQRGLARDEVEKIRLEAKETLDITIKEQTQLLETTTGEARDKVEKQLIKLRNLNRELAYTPGIQSVSSMRNQIHSTLLPNNIVRPWPITGYGYGGSTFSQNNISIEELQITINDLLTQVEALQKQIENKAD